MTLASHTGVSRREHLRRITGFSALPFVAAIGPLLAIPVISWSGGVSAWAAFAVGQSVGAGGAVLVEMGWSLTGPQAVARAAPAQRRSIYLSALASRALVLAIVAPIVLACACVLSRQHLMLAALSATSAMCMAFSSGWYFVGRGSVRGLALFDTLPKVVAIAFGCASIVWLRAPVEVLPVTTALTAMVFAGAPLALSELRSGASAGSSVPVRTVLREQSSAIGARAVSALYIALPVAVVSVAAPAAVATFAAAERLMRLGLAVLQAVPSAFQAYIAVVDGTVLTSRVMRVLRLNLLLGAIAGLLFVLTGPFALRLLLPGVEPIALPAWFAGGFVVAATITNRAIGNLGLVRYGRVDSILRGALIGAALGLPLLLVLSSEFGTSGAMSALAVAEVGVTIAMSRSLLRAMRDANSRLSDS